MLLFNLMLHLCYFELSVCNAVLLIIFNYNKQLIINSMLTAIVIHLVSGKYTPTELS